MSRLKSPQFKVRPFKGGFRKPNLSKFAWRQWFKFNAKAIGLPLHKLSALANQELPTNVSDFVRQIFYELKNPTSVSLYLVSEDGSKIKTVITAKRSEHEQERRAVNGNGISISVKSLDEELENTDPRYVAMNANNAGVFLYRDGKKQKVYHFSLDADVHEPRSESANGYNGPQQFTIPLKSASGREIVGCLVIEGKNLRLKKKAFIYSSLLYLAATSRYLYKTIKANLDQLTKLLKREIFTEALEIAIENFMKDESNDFGVIFHDIDDFKQFNSDYGHIGGDKTLAFVASVLMNSIRGKKKDLAARYGGEEMVTLVHAAKGDVLDVAERIRTNVATKTEVELEYGKVTLSSGVAMASTLKKALSSGVVAGMLAADLKEDFVAVAKLFPHFDEDEPLSNIPESLFTSGSVKGSVFDVGVNVGEDLTQDFTLYDMAKRGLISTKLLSKMLIHMANKSEQEAKDNGKDCVYHFNGVNQDSLEFIRFSDR